MRLEFVGRRVYSTSPENIMKGRNLITFAIDSPKTLEGWGEVESTFRWLVGTFLNWNLYHRAMQTGGMIRVDCCGDKGRWKGTMEGIQLEFVDKSFLTETPKACSPARPKRKIVRKKNKK